MIARPVNTFSHYHAHVYFGAPTVGLARSLCTEAGSRFGVQVGRVHEREVGPHPSWSCQLSFDRDQFEGLIPWLDENRQGLTILVHGVTGDDLADHTEHASWLGEPADLKLEMFRR